MGHFTALQTRLCTDGMKALKNRGSPLWVPSMRHASCLGDTPRKLMIGSCSKRIVSNHVEREGTSDLEIDCFVGPTVNRLGVVAARLVSCLLRSAT